MELPLYDGTHLCVWEFTYFTERVNLMSHDGCIGAWKDQQTDIEEKLSTYADVCEQAL